MESQGLAQSQDGALIPESTRQGTYCAISLAGSNRERGRGPRKGCMAVSTWPTTFGHIVQCCWRC